MDPELIDPIADPVTLTTPDPAKEAARQGYEQRQAQKQLEAMRIELEGFRRRAEEERLAKLSEEQRAKEELEAIKAETARLQQENLRRKVGAEYRLPEAMISRLVGGDEAALRADAEELANLLPKPKVGASIDPVQHNPSGARVYTLDELNKDPLLARKPEVIKAMFERRIKK